MRLAHFIHRVALYIVTSFLLILMACATRSSNAVTPRVNSVDSTSQDLVANQPSTAQPGEQTPTLQLHVPHESLISFAIRFHVGSQDDPAGKEGLTWLVAQLLAQGSTQTHQYTEILAKLFPMAASYGIRVDREMTTLRGRVHVDHGRTFQELFAQAYLQPAFSQSDFDRIRSEAINYLEKLLRYGQDEELAKAALYDFMFSPSPYRHPPQGTLDGLNAITLEDVRGFYRTRFSREQARLAIAGNYDTQLLASFEATWQHLPKSGATTSPAQSPKKPHRKPFQGQHLRLISRPGADASISIGAPIEIKRGQKDYYALAIANSWLGEHRNSKSHLFQIIRAQRGLNYGDYSYIEAFPEGGRRNKPPVNVARSQQLFEIWIRTLPNESAHFAIRAAIRELDRLIQHGLNQEQFEQTRNFLRKYILHYAESTHDRLGYMIDDEFYGLETSHLEMYQQMLNKLTLQDVNQAIRRHLQTQNIKIAILTGQAEQLMHSLTSNSPSPMNYANPKPKSILDEDKAIANYPLAISPEHVEIIDIEQMFAS